MLSKEFLFALVVVSFVNVSTGCCPNNCWYPWNCWNGCGNPCQETNQCPDVKCSEITSGSFRECETEEVCYRSEVCCKTPCGDKKLCLKKTNGGVDEFDGLVCPKITSCAKLVKDYQNPKECADDNECLRKEKCCTHPCDDNAVSDFPDKMCMTGQRQIYYNM